MYQESAANNILRTKIGINIFLKKFLNSLFNSFFPSPWQFIERHDYYSVINYGRKFIMNIENLSDALKRKLLTAINCIFYFRNVYFPTLYTAKLYNNHLCNKTCGVHCEMLSFILIVP